jgi:hypothetical protein
MPEEKVEDSSVIFTDYQKYRLERGLQRIDALERAAGDAARDLLQTLELLDERLKRVENLCQKK